MSSAQVVGHHGRVSFRQGGLLSGLSRLRGNLPERFLGEGRQQCRPLTRLFYALFVV